VHAWAEPVEGIPNGHRVSEGLLRGAQPDREGFEALASMGVRTVVDLRAGHSDADLVRGLDLDLVEIPIRPYAFGDADVARFLSVAADPDRAPVFVHCRYGSDRTGLMCAAYRVAVQGWSRDEAVAEMTTGGFGYHGIWTEPVAYIRSLDVDAVLPPAGR
jgi:protein tyrosine phosphatase (PTP) superfamily phosphohydrolase (DUF442 family)